LDEENLPTQRMMANHFDENIVNIEVSSIHMEKSIEEDKNPL